MPNLQFIIFCKAKCWLDKQTLVRQALYEYLLPEQRKRGRPRLTWIRTIEKDLEWSFIKLNLNNAPPEITIETTERLAEDRRLWK